MAGYGFGFGFRKAEQRAKSGPDLPVPAIVPAIMPNTQWDGTAGSGFTTVPTDPVRTTAKPAMRLMVPPDQFYTDELLIGVLAGANDNGSLYSNMGLALVRVHFEGVEYEITTPSFAQLSDANGNPRLYYGWWVKLKKPVGIAGESQVYFEAVPADATMQARVIGPYSFHAREELHDISIEVAGSQPAIAGQRYQSLSAALAYLRQQNAENPLVTISEAGDYILGSSGGGYGGTGYCTVTASAPVNIVHSATTGSFVAYRPTYNGLRFKGANVTIDFALAHAMYFEVSGPPRQFWLDGCNVTNSNGRESLFRNAPSDTLGYLIGGKPILTECHITDVPRAGINASLVRGCSIERSWSDLFNGAQCVVQNDIVDHDSSWFRSDHHAMTLSYSGPAGEATIETTGYRTFIASEDGLEVGNFTLGSSHSDWLTGTNFFVSNVVDWINNDLPEGWSATLVDDAHRGTQLSTAGNLGQAIATPIDVKDAPLELYCAWNYHTDLYQKQNTAAVEENMIFAFNTGFGISAQDIFLSGTPGINDMLVFNNAFANDNPVIDRSQLSAAHSHVVIAHNSLSSQPLLIRNDLTYAADNYCLLANNVAPGIELVSATETGLAIVGNHVQIATEKTPPGTSSGGTENSLFANAKSGNFAPKSKLLSELRPSTVPVDALGAARETTAPIGAQI